MQTRLVVVGGDATPSEVDLELPITVGRGWDNGLCLPHPLVSRNHCRLVERDGLVVVEDLGSLNGTYVGRVRVESPTPLPPGELLTIGTVTFRAVYVPPEGQDGVSEDSDAAEPATGDRHCVMETASAEAVDTPPPIVDDTTIPLPAPKLAPPRHPLVRPESGSHAKSASRSLPADAPANGTGEESATVMHVRGPQDDGSA